MSSGASVLTNPTGTPTPPVIVNPSTSSSGISTGAPGTYNFGNTGNPNPSQPPTATNPYAPAQTSVAQPAAPVSQNPTGSTGAPTGQVGVTSKGTEGTLDTTNTFGLNQGQQDQTLEELDKTYGSGMGAQIYQYLQSEGGYNSALTTQDVDSTTALMQQQIATGLGALNTNLAESGISPNSSTAALETSNYEANATLGENEVTAQDFFNMWNSSQSNELSELESVQQGTGTEKANSGGGILQAITGGLGAAASIAAAPFTGGLSLTALPGAIESM